MSTARIPQALIDACASDRERRAWLAQLPSLIAQLAGRWSIFIQQRDPFDASAAWVAPATRAAGTRVVLKLGMPHFEAEHEIDGLRFWDGEPTVRLLESDDAAGAMLLERCEPGTSLRERGEAEQDDVIAALLRRLWRDPPAPSVFRSLAGMIAHWSAETRADRARWPDAVLVQQGLNSFEQLADGSAEVTLLATDLHAGNVLRAEREPWLVIDPKPFVGDRAYDATQHLLNCRTRLHDDARATISRVARLLDVDAQRVTHWLFARLAAEPRAVWDHDSMTLAHVVRQLL